MVIVTAGTSDLPVAEEARITCMFGHPVETVYDAGVAGIHRILAHSALLQQGRVIIVVAGMEGRAALGGGRHDRGAGHRRADQRRLRCRRRWSALLGMLNSCSPGLAVVNIDNGFGAACMAAAINRAA